MSWEVALKIEGRFEGAMVTRMVGTVCVIQSKTGVDELKNTLAAYEKADVDCEVSMRPTMRGRLGFVRLGLGL